MAAQISQNSRIYFSSDVAPAAHAITTVTKAAPAVVTVAAVTGIAVGDVVVPTATGFKSIDDFPFRVAAVTGSAITLEDSDTTGEVGAGNVGTLNEYTMQEVCLATFGTTHPAGTVIDQTTMCDIARRSRTGLPGQGTWTSTGHWDRADAGQLLAFNAYRTRTGRFIRTQWPDGSGMLFAGDISTFNTAAGVDASITFTMGGQINGRVQFINPTGP